MKKIWNKKGIMLAIGLMLVLSTFAVGMNSISAQGEIFQDAKEIEVPGEWDGELNETNEWDLYTFELESSQIIDVEFTSWAEDGQELTFYDFD